MGQRVGILLLAAFVTCFVGSCAAGTLALLGAGAGLARQPPELPPAPAPVADLESVPPAEAEPEHEPEPERESEPDPFATPPAPAFEQPTLGRAQFAVYRLERPRGDPWRALQQAAKGSGLAVYLDRAPEDVVPPYLVLRELPASDYAPIEGAILEAGHGLTAAQRDQLPRTAQPVSVVDAFLPPGTGPLLEASKVLAGFAQATGGLLWDEETREYYTLEAWRSLRLASWERGVPMAMRQFTVPVSVDAEVGTASLNTAGLRHFGLAELELHDVPADEVERAIALLNAAAQTVLEGDLDLWPGPLAIDLRALRHRGQREALEAQAGKGAAGRVELTLEPGADDKVPTLLVVPGGEGTPRERMGRALAGLLGDKPQE